MTNHRVLLKCGKRVTDCCDNVRKCNETNYYDRCCDATML